MGNPHPVDLHVGKRLRLKRTTLGLSQEAIGKQIGITFQQIQKYERGVNRMGASRLYDFARILGIPVEYFFEGYGEYANDGGEGLALAEPSSEFEHEKISNRETLEVMRAYYRIKNPALRKRVIELIKAMADEAPAEKQRAKAGR